MSKEAKKSGRSKSKSKTDRGRFQIIPDYQSGSGQVPNAPAQFSDDFRLLRQLMRWAKRYGVLREGKLLIFASRNDMQKGNAWRTVDLARSVLSFRSSDRKIVINTVEVPSHLFRIKIDTAEKFKQWVNQLRTHRQYRQAKTASAQRLVAPKQSEQPTPTENAKKEEISSTVVALDRILDKMENMKAEGHQTDGIQKMQQEYLTTAKEAQTKLHELLTLMGIESHLKWEPTPTAKKYAAPRPPPAKREIEPEPKRKSERSTKTPPPKIAPIQERKAPVSPAPVSPPETPSQKADEQKAPEKPMMVATFVPSVPSSSGTPSPVSSAQSGRTTPSSEIDDASAVEDGDNVPDGEGDQSVDSEKEEQLSAQMPVYREKLPAPMGPQPSIFRLAMSAIGRDIMQFSLPAAMMQPLSFVQVMCEELEYSDLIDLAAATAEPHMRMLYVACFAVSRYGSTAFRSGRKPFNPLLGQTFEFKSPHLGWRFVSEQVQHKPAVTAGYAEGRGWRWWHDCELLVTFGGNSMEVKPAGVVYLHLEKWEETYSWTKVTSVISGLLSGTFVLDHYGDMIIKCSENKMTAKIHFKQLTQTNDRRGVVDGKVMDGEGQVLEKMYGKWTDCLYVGESSDTSAHCVWRLAASPPDYSKYYGYTRFALSLNEYRPEIHGALPKTDSRYRPDQKALELGKPDEADRIKKNLEGRQRQRRKHVEAGKRQAPKPLWFRETSNKNAMKGARWEFNDNYWKSKERSFKDAKFLPLW